jgi:hypothetical protein
MTGFDVARSTLQFSLMWAAVGVLVLDHSFFLFLMCLMRKLTVLADVILTLCLLIGVSAVVIGFIRLPPRWEKCTGRVLSSSVEDDAEGAKRVARVEYTYDVGGISYKGEDSRRWWKDAPRHHPSRGIARRFVSRRPPGANTTVFYDPADPSKSALREPRYKAPLIYAISTLCGNAPWTQSLIALFYAAFFASPFAERSKCPARRWPLLIPAVCWFLYGWWEWLAEGNIRADLLFILPVLLLTSVGAPVLLLFTRSRACQRG